MQNTQLKILCLNSGSSSLKFSLYRIGNNTEQLLLKGAVERIGLSEGRFWLRNGNDSLINDLQGNYSNHDAALDTIFTALNNSAYNHVSAIGHRVVHGGEYFTAPVVIDQQVIAKLEGLIPFAPLHLPSEIQCINVVAKRLPGLPQIACFDTAFHRKMPEVARHFPLPHSLWDEGVQRYGFHGLSYEYIMEALTDKAPERIIIAHLGNGASMAAVYQGKAVDTTMGFTPTGGFMMGTRCGDLDPGVLLYLMQEKGLSAAQIDKIVNQQSGLLGVSEISSDIKTLLENQENPKAKLALDMFCYQARKQIGALTATLNGLDLLVFTGGIGEKADPVRSTICSGLDYLGILFDEEQNAIHAETITKESSSCKVMIIPTKEDLMIARHTKRLLA